MDSNSKTAGRPRQNEFICGVVEGFYGRPWTTEQRKDLFAKMRKWGMESYLYAPKDDYKHRAYWRELYTVEEADHLGCLISAAKENNVRFIYALSPGLDIVYSSAKDVSALKRKLEQVNQLGCDAFAVLFDDIDTEMTKADKEMFKSFAHAQVSVTNEAYQHINVNCFLFCPTQYCATRAVPNVRSSEYLKTLGAKLDLEIDIMWTGPKVISKDITLESIEEISEVLRRPPVIWDNLHANDYDQKRLFLGPYNGRSPQLISRLRGVLTNPNCEYGANFIAIHTLAQWSRCCEDAKRKIDEPMNSDAKLETESEDGNADHVPDNLDPHVYHPGVALKNACQEWLHEFYRERVSAVWGPLIKPQVVLPPLPPVPVIGPLTITGAVGRPNMVPPVDPAVPAAVACAARELAGIVENGEAIQPIPPPEATMMNSLVADNKILPAVDVGNHVPVEISNEPESNSSLPTETANSSESDITELPSKDDRKCSDVELESTHSNAAAGLEPMDYNSATPPNPSPQENTEREDVPMGDSSGRTSGMSSPDDGVDSGTQLASEMNLDSELELTSSSSNNHRDTPSASSTTMQVENSTDGRTVGPPDLTVEDLLLLCDLFYLPYEHGSQGLQILHEFQWLKSNLNTIAGTCAKDKLKPEVAEWYDRATRFNDLTSRVDKLSTKINDIPNRELLYEVYPYMWDIRGVVSMLNSYVKWLASGQISTSTDSAYVEGTYTWFSKGWREAFMSGDQEPWVIRGGLTSELQRLIPVDRGTDLYMYKVPPIPNAHVYTIRPYRADDESAAYRVCLATFKDGLSAAEDFEECPNFAGDLKIGGYLKLAPDVSFVVEDENEVIVGVAIAVNHGKEFRRKLNMSWMDEMRALYPIPGDHVSSYTKEIVSSIQTDMSCIPDDVAVSHPAELRFCIRAALTDPSVPKRLMTCVLAALRANGVFGCFIEVSDRESYLRDFFKKLGFVEFDNNFMGRSF